MRVFLIMAMFGLTAGQVYAFECNECHSKNPAMVRMHKAVQGRGCFDCHRIGEKLMGKGMPKDKDSLMKRRSVDPLCLDCHSSNDKPQPAKQIH